MKKYLVVLLFVLTTTLLFAHNNSFDIIYLKNESIIQGIIIEKIFNESIIIETADRNIFEYQMDMIEIIVKEPKNSLKKGFQSGYKGIVELGYQTGTNYRYMDALKFNIINGYQINSYFSLGLGTGLRYYFDDRMAFFPVFADFRATFTDKKVSPYLSLGVGYSFYSKGFERMGFLLNPTLGVSFKYSDKSAIIVGLGYERIKVHHYASYNGAISLNFGISF